MLDYNTFLPYINYTPLALLGLLLLIQLYYIAFIYGKLARYRIPTNTDREELPALSVVICAYNEQANLARFLLSILQQDYPNFEVVLVDDCSTDESKWILQRYAQQFPDRLKVVEIKDHIQLKHQKKFAVTLGIKAARHEHLVFTDADCEPQSANWLRQMGSTFSSSTDIILGYSPYFKSSGFLNKLIRFETTHTAMSYLAYALHNNAYMGVGRNMGYSKSLFFSGKGFHKHMHIKSGDDDLFVNQNATADNVQIVLHPDAHMWSVPKDSWKKYYKQKARHAGASVLYKSKHKRMLATQLLSALLFYVLLLLCLALYPTLWYIPLSAYAMRLIAQWITFRSIYKKLQVADLWWWIPCLDLLYYFYICINGLFNRKKKKQSWS